MSSEFRIIPYDRSLNSCHRRSESLGLSSFLQRGGQIRPMDLSSRQAPVGVDPEAAALLSPSEQMLRAYEKTSLKTHRISRIMMIGVICMTIVVISVFVAILLTITRVNSQMDAVSMSIAPHAEQVINSTLEMIADTRDTLHNLHTVSDSGSELATTSVPNLLKVTNNTASISDRIAKLLEHPEIKLSLGG